MEWRTIDSAPKDGRAILLLSREGYIGFGRMKLEDAHYVIEDGEPWLREDACWIGARPPHGVVEMWFGGSTPSEATHWASVPPPPGDTE